jgi:hypothetical protein
MFTIFHDKIYSINICSMMKEKLQGTLMRKLFDVRYRGRSENWSQVEDEGMGTLGGHC